jgi:acetyltransferase-like isoleucine patch superfamily enzyme
MADLDPDLDPDLERRIADLVDARVRAALEEHRASAAHVPPNDLLMYELVYGDRSKLHIHPTAVINNALFNLSSGEITIEEYAFFGHSVSVLTGTHDITLFDRERQVGVPKSGRDIVIGRGVWVSSGAMVLGPCRLGEHSVVAAASVVTGDVPPYTVVAGTPARPVRTLQR